MHVDEIKHVFEGHDLYLNWRKPRLFNEPCDVIIKHYLPVI